MHLGQISSTGGGTGVSYTWRGDPVAVDFTQASLTLDGALHTLDLSAIIPSTAKLVHLRIRMRDATAGKLFAVTHPDNVNLIALIGNRNPVGNQYAEIDPICPCNSDGEIQYYGGSSITTVELTVLGWFE